MVTITRIKKEDNNELYLYKFKDKKLTLSLESPFGISNVKKLINENKSDIFDKEFKLVKEKIKQNPNYVQCKEFKNWKNENSLSPEKISELLSVMPKDCEVDLGWFIKKEDRIIEDSILHIQRNRNVGYPTAKKIFLDKQTQLMDRMQMLTPVLEKITKELLKEKDFIDLIKSVIHDTTLAVANHEEIQNLIASYYHNDCRGYIVKTLTLKYLFQTYFECSSMFLDLYWDRELHNKDI